MGNTIKYNTNSESKALKVNNFWIGTGDVDKGPTENTGFYNVVNPPSNGYTIYLNKGSQGPSIYVASNDAQLIDLTNKIANTNYTGVTECFNYFRGQSDKALFNRQYESIVTDGLVLNLDAGFVGSYPQNGSTIYDLSGNGNNGTLENGAAFDSADGGAFTLSSGNYISIADNNAWDNSNLTLSVWIYRTASWSPNWWQDSIMGHDEGGGSRNKWIWSYDGSKMLFHINTPEAINVMISSSNHSISLNTWYNLVMTKNSNSYKFYVNGSSVGSTTDSTVIPNVNSPLIIGTGEGGALFNGKIGGSLIYNRALSDDEVLKNYNALNNRFNSTGLLVSLDAGNPASYNGGNTWYDLSGNNNNGTLNGLTGGPTYSSNNGGTMVFTGTKDHFQSGKDDYVSLGNLGTIGNYQTIEMWIKPNGYTYYDNICDMNFGTYTTGIHEYPNGSGNVGPRIEINGGSASWNWSSDITNNSNFYFSSPSFSLPTNNWYHIVYTNNNGVISVYRNGTLHTSTYSLNGSTPPAPGYLTTFGDVVIGKGFGYDSTRFFNGNVSIFNIYNKALTGSEVTQNFNTNKSRFGL